MKTQSATKQRNGLATPYAQLSYAGRVLSDIRRSPVLYLMLLPVLVYYIMFCYKPMYGALIAFYDFIPGVPMFQSKFVGWQNFVDFFQYRNFGRVVLNTLTISVSSIIFGFPAPIILALLLNELRSKKFSRTVQTVSYMPHFISLVVICGMVRDFTGGTGFITKMLSDLGLVKSGIALLSQKSLFVPIYVISDIWQGVGYGSIIYLAALTNVDQELYEAAKIDGAGRWKQTLHVTLPGIMPTIITMLVLRLGRLMNVGFEKIILLYNPQVYSVADVISSYIYRVGLQNADFSYSTAVGLFNSVINLIILMAANMTSRKISGNGLW